LSNNIYIWLLMLFTHITLAFAFVTLLIFVGLVYLYVKHREEIGFRYASLLFLCAVVVLFGQYHLELRVAPPLTIFWRKFLYLGAFGYIYTIPLFISYIMGEEIRRNIRRGLGVLTLICYALIAFTNLIISNKTEYHLDLLRAGEGALYPYFMFLMMVVVIYSYGRLILNTKRVVARPGNYYPLIVGIGIGIATTILDIIGILSKRPVIPGLRNPSIFAVFISSICFAWTFISQYSWTFTALSESKERIEKLIEKSNKAFIEFVQLIAKTLDAKDHYTAGHSLRVMNYAVKIAKALNLPEEEVEVLKQACLLHDIGKIGIPDGILNKKSLLSDKDREHIYRHPVLGRKILSTVSEFQSILDIIYTHHERIDGGGYPGGLKKEEIPLLARIIAVADAYDAMLSERPYRRAKTPEQAMEELKKVKGSQLDEKLVDKFIEIISAT